MRLRPRQIEGGRRLARRGGAGGRRRREIHHRQASLAPGASDRVRDVVVAGSVAAVAALLVEGALAVLMVRPPLDPRVTAGDAALEYPAETVAGRSRRHTADRSIRDSDLRVECARFELGSEREREEESFNGVG